MCECVNEFVCVICGYSVIINFDKFCKSLKFSLAALLFQSVLCALVMLIYRLLR